MKKILHLIQIIQTVLVFKRAIYKMICILLYFITPHCLIAEQTDKQEYVSLSKIKFFEDTYYSIDSVDAKNIKTKNRTFLGRDYTKIKEFDKQGKKKSKTVISKGSIVKQDLFPGISVSRAVHEKEDNSLAGQINRKLLQRANTTKKKVRQSFNTNYIKIKTFDQNGRKNFKKVISESQVEITEKRFHNKKDHIQQLKNGHLLVRLNTNENLINYYLKNLELEKANIEIKKQKEINSTIINGFKENWSFCPVYFFYSKHYSEIKKNNFYSVFKDINETKLTDQEIKNFNNSFLLAYFGKPPSTVQFNSLVLTDKNLKQLNQSTPRYVRTYKGLWFLERSVKKTIQKLQKKIMFYDSRKK